MKVDFKEIKDYFNRNRYKDEFSHILGKMFEKVSQIIDENDVLYFYPKYLFTETQILELYFILKNNKLVKATITEDNQIVINIFYSNQIINIDYKSPIDNNGNYKLSIYFKNNMEPIIFNSIEDTNSHWKYKFDNVISNIAIHFARVS